MSVAEALLRMVVAMAVVLGLMWCSAKLMRSRSGMAPSRRPRVRSRRTAEVDLEVVSRQPLSRTAAVAVVRSGERTWLVGITDQQVTLLSDTDIDLRDVAVREEAPEPEAPRVLQRTTRLMSRPAGAGGVGAMTFGELVDAMRERTVRR